MKAVTVSRVARLIIVLAVVVIIAIPAYSGLQGYQIEGTNFVEVDSVYELDNMTESNLKSNINTVIGSSNDYMIVYGSVIDAVSASDLDTLVHEIKTSGAKTASLLDKDGKLATQQTIVGSNGLSQYVYTGIKLSSSLIKTVTPTVDINVRTPNGLSPISNVEIIGVDDTYNLKIELPMVAVASAIYLESAINLDIGIMYSDYFKINMQLDIPSSMFKPSDTPEIPTPYISDDEKTIQVETNISMPEDVTATVDGVTISVTTSGEISVTSTDGTISESLRASLEKDGKLILNVEGEDPIIIEKDTAETVLDMLDQIIEKVKE